MLQDETMTSLKKFDFNASTLYLVSMSTFWILTIATGRFDLHCTSVQNALLKVLTSEPPLKDTYLEMAGTGWGTPEQQRIGLIHVIFVWQAVR